MFLNALSPQVWCTVVHCGTPWYSVVNCALCIMHYLCGALCSALCFMQVSGALCGALCGSHCAVHTLLCNLCGALCGAPGDLSRILSQFTWPAAPQELITITFYNSKMCHHHHHCQLCALLFSHANNAQLIL